MKVNDFWILPDFKVEARKVVFHSTAAKTKAFLKPYFTSL